MARRDPDIVSFVFGLAFLGTAVLWGPSPGGHDVEWRLAVLLVTVGTLGLAVTLTRTR